MRRWARNPKIVVAAVMVTAGLAWLAFGFFGVHLLFVDERVDEAAPVFAAGDPPSASTPSSPTTNANADATTSPVSTPPSATIGSPLGTSQTDITATPATPAMTGATTASPSAPPHTQPAIVTEFEGPFVGRNHPTSGTAIVLGNGTDLRYLRFESFETDNGPDLNVYLVNGSAGGVEDFVDLGELKGNIGDQNYEIPPDVDLTVHDTVLIWCVRFSSAFGEATLTPT